MKTIKTVLCYYFIIGGAITLMQSSLVKFLDSETSAERAVWKRYPVRLTAAESLRAHRKGTLKEPHLMEYTIALACWLPDHVAYLRSEDASFKGYLLGGRIMKTE